MPRKSVEKRPSRMPNPKIVNKKCAFCQDKDINIDYKNIDLVSKYVTSKGKISSRRINGNCAKHQRKVAKEIDRARFLALVPYV